MQESQSKTVTMNNVQTNSSQSLCEFGDGRHTGNAVWVCAVVCHSVCDVGCTSKLRDSAPVTGTSSQWGKFAWMCVCVCVYACECVCVGDSWDEWQLLTAELNWRESRPFLPSPGVSSCSADFSAIYIIYNIILYLFETYTFLWEKKSVLSASMCFIILFLRKELRVAYSIKFLSESFRFDLASSTA